MDKTTEIYKKAYSRSIPFVAAAILVFTLIKPYLQYRIEQSTAGNMLFVSMNVFIYTLIATLIFLVVFGYEKLQWKKKYKSIWVGGLWLSIHVKENGKIRIGTVEIDQDFHQIKAKGINVSPSIYEGEGEYKTEWNYQMGEVTKHDGSLRYIGCYKAYKDIAKDDTYNSGIHTLKNFSSGSKDIRRMEGRFNDVVKMKKGSIEPIDTTEHCGQLYLFRIEPDCERHLRNSSEKNGIDFEKLKCLHEQSRFKCEPYVEKIKDLLIAHSEQAVVK